MVKYCEKAPGELSLISKNITLSFIADLIHPNIYDLSELQTEGTKDILRISRENKLPLALIVEEKHLQSYLFSKYPELASEIKSEKMEYQRLLAEFSLLNNKLQRYGIKPILIKAPNFFPYTSDNLDVLIRKDDKNKAIKILKESGFFEIEAVREPGKYLFKKFILGKENFAFHLHEAIAWDGVKFLDERSISERSKFILANNSKLYFPSFEDCLLITVAHALYENKQIKLYDFYIYLLCCFAKDLNWNHIRYSAKNRGWLFGLERGIHIFSKIEKLLYGKTIINANLFKKRLSNNLFIYLHKKSLLKFPLHLSKVFWKFQLIIKILKDKKEKSKIRLSVYSIYLTLLRYLHLIPRKPILITFSGLDGSGKTTQATAAAKLLKHCGLMVNTYWSRPGISTLMHFVHKLGKILFIVVKQNELMKKFPKSSDIKKYSKMHPIMGSIWSLLSSIDLIVRYFINVRIPLLLGKAVICDRYTYDAVVDIDTLIGKDSGFRKKLIFILSPKPDIAFFLDGAPERLFKRMDKSTSLHSLKLMHVQKLFYLNLIKGKEVIINTDSNFSKVNNEVSNKLINLLKNLLILI